MQQIYIYVKPVEIVLLLFILLRSESFPEKQNIISHSFNSTFNSPPWTTTSYENSIL